MRDNSIGNPDLNQSSEKEWPKNYLESQQFIKNTKANELWVKHRGALPPSADENNDGKKVSCASILGWFRKACNFSESKSDFVLIQ
jgi:hypothetical protein